MERPFPRSENVTFGTLRTTHRAPTVPTMEKITPPATPAKRALAVLDTPPADAAAPGPVRRVSKRINGILGLNDVERGPRQSRGRHSQSTQIIRHIAELSQHSRIPEVSGSWIASATKRDRTCVTQHFPKTFRPLYRGGGT
jgi:hypothetical protein